MNTLLDYIHALIGQAPSGFAFLEYIFAFVLVGIALFIVYKAFEALFQLFF